MVLIIAEAPTDLLTPQTAPEERASVKRVKKDPQTTQSNSDPENGGEDRARRGGKPGVDPPPAVDTESDPQEIRRKPSFLRLKVIDHTPLLQNPSDNEAKAEGKKAQSSQLSKTHGQYRKLFKEVGGEELLKQSYTCALQKDMLYHGKLYVSDNWVCFHSKVFGKGIKIAIPALSVTLIKKTKTAILVPNALVIATADERHVFVSFLSRDTTYKLLRSVCPHLDAEKMGHDAKLDFSADFSDLDGVVRKRRQKLGESSSSGSQTPDYEKPSEFPPLPQKYLKGPKKAAEVAVHADIHLQKGAADTKHGTHRNGHVRPAVETERGTPPQQRVLTSLLLLYLFLVFVLVLSSCYMAFKIISLEERLSALGSLVEYPYNENALHSSDQPDISNAEIYGELSTNLLKLDKVQKNLRKLLEET